jgi:hypothetical protein
MFVRALKHALTEYHKFHPEIPRSEFAEVQEYIPRRCCICCEQAERSTVATPRMRAVAHGGVLVGAPSMEMER